MINKQVIFSLALIGVSGAAWAQKVEQQAPVVVTANAYAQTVDAAMADVTVIDREAIDASGAADVYDLLRLQAGINIVRSGGPGTQTSLFMRGTNSNHVLVLIDGVRVASMNTGGFAWEQLPLDTVQRIEIVRGPRATVWGSDAIGGVIQIFTRKLDGVAGALRYGSYGDAAGSVGFGQWHNGEGFSINAGMRHVRGFSAQNPQGYSYNPDDDGLRDRNISARAATHVGSQRVSGSLYFNDNTQEFDQGVSHNIEQALSVQVQGPLAAHWQHTVRLGAAREDLSTPAFATAFHSDRRSLDWRNRFDITANQQLIAGINLLHESGTSVNTGTQTDAYAGTRNNRAVFVGWYGNAGRIDWQLAARRDHNDRFGGASTASAALGLRLSPLARVLASWGQGFRAPNLNEQFSPGYGGYYAGNPMLKPERSHTSELALELTPSAHLRIKLAAFRTDISQLISFTGGSLFQAENIARARIDGAAATLHWHAPTWSLEANASWQNPRDLATDTALLRRPKRKATVVLQRHFGTRFDAGVEWLAVSTRPEIGGDLPGYSLLNARSTWHINPRFDLHLRAANLFARDYGELRGFNTPGRSFWLELAWHPQH
ncbi:MAG: TonB-dependent receptor [Xanthomonadales bacterium]|nr:TonB-dependent receptor [Xanthomonadales bacterium]